MLRSKGLKDATCVGWFGDDGDCSVGFPPEAIDHVSSSVPIWLRSIRVKSPMIRATPEVDNRDEGGELQGFEATLRVQVRDSKSPGWKLQVLD